ncbi:MAG: N4-gp56 family major capsid protein [Clostridia bacterium]|nr:N4-gp56 family major capsid protein [Clostridia bacterium]
MATTKINDLINPQVMADMISAKVEKKIVVAPFAKVDNTLVGVPGNTITVPKYGYIGDAADVAEGVSCDTVKLSTGVTTATVKKAMKAVELTDEAVLSGYGNPVGETNNQLAKAIAAKVDNDAMTALQGAILVFDGSANLISYNQIVDAIDLFDEEVNSDKVMFINPRQVATLRKDSNFISADKYPNNVIMTGEIGTIANARIVPSKKVPHVDGVAGERTVTIAGTVAIGDKFNIDGYEFTATAATAKNVADGLVALISADSDCEYSASNSNGVITLTEKTGFYGVGLYNVPVLGKTSTAGTITARGTYSGTTIYKCPIVKLNNDSEAEEDAAAITIYLKKDTSVETERDTLARKTDISVDKHYTVALTNDSKVVIAKIKA